MCCNKRRQQREFLHTGIQYQTRQRGCCSARRRQALAPDYDNHGAISHHRNEVSQVQQPAAYGPYPLQHLPMAGILIVSLGIGAEKLGRKISDKRLERKEKKASEREIMYAHAESSSSAANEARKRRSRHIPNADRKSEEARRDGDRRRSVSSGRALLPEDAPPPRYEDVVRNTTR